MTLGDIYYGGVYTLFYRGKAIYVGESCNIQARLLAHRTYKLYRCREDLVSISVIKMPNATRKEREIVESLQIKKHGLTEVQNDRIVDDLLEKIEAEAVGKGFSTLLRRRNERVRVDRRYRFGGARRYLVKDYENIPVIMVMMDMTIKDACEVAPRPNYNKVNELRAKSKEYDRLIRVAHSKTSFKAQARSNLGLSDEFHERVVELRKLPRIGKGKMKRQIPRTHAEIAEELGVSPYTVCRSLAGIRNNSRCTLT